MSLLARTAPWILDAHGVDGEAVPPSVLTELERYTRLSREARRWHSTIEVSGLVVAASIPALAAFAADSRLIAILGSLAVLINGLRALGSYKENWTSRARARARYAIEKEIALFTARHGRYAETGASALLVEAVEDICAREQEGWVALRLSYEATGVAPKPAT